MCAQTYNPNERVIILSKGHRVVFPVIFLVFLKCSKFSSHLTEYINPEEDALEVEIKIDPKV